MKLVGLLDAALDDPALAAARDLARRGDLEPLDLTAPPALRPFVVAAAAADGSGGGRPVLAVTATSREAEDLAAALGCLLPADEVRTPSGGAWRYCAGSRIPTATRCAWWSPRSGPCSNRN